MHIFSQKGNDHNGKCSIYDLKNLFRQQKVTELITHGNSWISRPVFSNRVLLGYIEPLSYFLADSTTLGVPYPLAGIVNTWQLDKHYHDCLQLWVLQNVDSTSLACQFVAKRAFGRFYKVFPARKKLPFHAVLCWRRTIFPFATKLFWARNVFSPKSF